MINIISIIYLGLASLILQVVLIRELITAFYGHELFLGIVLALWLISTGLGSLSAGRIGRFLNSPRLLLLLPLSIALALILSRLARMILSPSGIMPDLFLAIGWSALIVLPPAFILGVLFVRLAKRMEKDNASAVSLAYIIESAGFVLGALFYNFLFYRLPSLTVILILAFTSFILALVYCFRKKFFIFYFLSFILLPVALIGLNFSGPLDRYLLRYNFPGENLIDAVNSKFSSLALTRANGQYNFYANGHLIDNTQNAYHQELLVDLPLLVATSTNNLLLVGNSLTGLGEKTTHYRPEKIIALEPDKKYYALAEKWLEYNPPLTTEFIFTDARPYLNNSPERFDAIIINQGAPTTLATNRYYTKEFFALLEKHLTPNGLVALKIDTTPNYTIGAQNELLSGIYKTLSTVFSYVLALPDYEVVFLASPGPINHDQKAVKEKYTRLNLNNQYVLPEYVNWRFTNDRVEPLNKVLAESPISPNTILKPTLYFQNLKIALAKSNFHPSYFISPAVLLPTFIFLLFFFLFLIKRYDHYKLQITNYKLILLSALPEFSLLSLEIILILLFQSYLGQLYTPLAFITAIILAGIALGSATVYKLTNPKTTDNHTNLTSFTNLTKLSFLSITLAFALPLIIVWQFNDLLSYQSTYYLLALIAGLAIGTKFPLINRLYLKTSSNLGAIYGADLIGASLGALITGTVLLPLFGISFCLIILLSFTIISIIIILLLKT